MATTITITPETTSINATANSTTVTISSAVSGTASDAEGLTFLGSVSGFAGGTGNSVESALNHLANNFFTQTSAPTAGTTGLAEGDLFYDTDDNQLKIYREVTTGNFSFVPIMIGNDSSDSDTIDAGSFQLNRKK